MTMAAAHVTDARLADRLGRCRRTFPSWRSAYAVITNQGRAKLRRAAPVYLAAIRREFVAALDSHQVEVVEAATSAVVDHPAQERSDG
ncbi:MAG TPA: hypothetical protein VK988_09850 [Acidimicrobiales bacterium]|nr:hypothetical protein [Acidimicrobiales bacterium]